MALGDNVLTEQWGAMARVVRKVLTEQLRTDRFIGSASFVR